MHKDYEKEINQFNAEIMEDYRKQKRINQMKARLKLVCFGIGAVIVLIMIVAMIIATNSAMKGLGTL